MSLSSKKRPHSVGRSELQNTKNALKDIHRSTPNNNNIGFSTVNPATLSNINNALEKKKINKALPRPKFLLYIEENIIGKNYVFDGPYGLRRGMLVFVCILFLMDFISYFKSSIVIIQQQVDH
jgi:hypothetical protein